jgi:hypothetical protein
MIPIEAVATLSLPAPILWLLQKKPNWRTLKARILLQLNTFSYVFILFRPFYVPTANSMFLIFLIINNKPSTIQYRAKQNSPFGRILF